MQHAHPGADTGLSAYSHNVPSGVELVALRGVQFDTIISDDDVGSWVSVIYRKFMGASVRSRRRNISSIKNVPARTARFDPLPRRKVSRGASRTTKSP